MPPARLLYAAPGGTCSQTVSPAHCTRLVLPLYKVGSDRPAQTAYLQALYRTCHPETLAAHVLVSRRRIRQAPPAYALPLWPSTAAVSSRLPCANHRYPGRRPCVFRRPSSCLGLLLYHSGTLGQQGCGVHIWLAQYGVT